EQRIMCRFNAHARLQPQFSEADRIHRVTCPDPLANVKGVLEVVRSCRTRPRCLHSSQYLLEIRDWPVGIVSEIVVVIPEIAQKIAGRLAACPVVKFSVVTLGFRGIPAFEAHLKRAGM